MLNSEPTTDAKGNSTLRFAIAAAIIVALGYFAGFASFTPMYLVAASAALLLALVLFSDYRPKMLMSAGIPTLNLRRLILVTVAAGIGVGLGVPTVTVSKTDRTSAQSGDVAPVPHEQRADRENGG